jgi:hypothetical protein
MILLLEFLVEVIDRETKKSLHEFRRYARIDSKGTVVRGRLYRQDDFDGADDCGLSFAARQSVLSELCARDSRSSDNPIKVVRDSISGSPWALDSVMLGKTLFITEGAYNEHLRRDTTIQENLL